MYIAAAAAPFTSSGPRWIRGDTAESTPRRAATLGTRGGYDGVEHDMQECNLLPLLGGYMVVV